MICAPRLTAFCGAKLLLLARKINNLSAFNIGIAVIIFGLIMLGFLWNINSEIGKIRADIAEFRSESSGTEARLPNVEKGL